MTKEDVRRKSESGGDSAQAQRKADTEKNREKDLHIMVMEEFVYFFNP